MATSNKETLDHSYGERVERNRHYILNSKPATMASLSESAIIATGIDSKRSRLISLLSQLVIISIVSLLQ